MTFIIEIGELETYQECLDSPDSRNTPLSPTEYCDLKGSLSPHLQWDWGRTNVSLGPPFGLPQQPGIQVLAEPTGPYQDEPVPVALPAQTVGDVVMALPADFKGWHNAAKGEYVGVGAGGKLIIKTIPANAGGVTVNGDVVIAPPEEDEVGWIADLGDLVDIYQDYSGQGGTDPQPPAVITTPTATVIPGTGGPVAAQCATGASPVWKKVCGVYKWVYPKRKRRRQLLTNRDYDDLLKLQTLKVNANMTAAISKALTR